MTYTPAGSRLTAVAGVLALVVLASCAPAATPIANLPATLAPAPNTPTPLPSFTSTLTLTPTATSTQTPIPTATPTPAPTATPSTLDLTDNILVLGSDQRPGDGGWRTDTVMVVAVDYKSNQVGIVSLPRDLYVDIPGYGMGRLNQVDILGEEAKYPGGGPALLQRVLTDTLDIPTQHFVRVEMNGLVRLVDALGGVTVTLSCPLYEITPDETSPTGYKAFDLPAGPVYLNGEDAKKFATYRYVTTDFGRTQRQQQLIWAIRNRVLQGDVLGRIPELWRALGDTFNTDLSLLDVLKLAKLGVGLKPEQVHGLVFSRDIVADFTTEQGAMVLIVQNWARLEMAKEAIFRSKLLAESGVVNPNDCPPPPGLLPTRTPAPPVSPTPSGGATATSQP
jgi:polyisoprenyl-teichoic acid--peptidoglycan teichoic acid transferase